MFKKFKRRQLLSNLAILTLLLLVIFTTLYLSAYQDIKERKSIELSRLVDIEEVEIMTDQIFSNPDYRNSFVVVVENNQIIDSFSSPFIKSDFMQDAYDLIQSEEGLINIDGYTFQYLVKHENDSIIIGFHDITRDQEILDSFLTRYILIFLGSIFVTLIVTYIITVKSIRPVEESYLKQKEFIANASHELKTPLTVINTNIDVLLASSELKNNKWLQYIKNEAIRMNKLTNDLLYLAKTSDKNINQKEKFNASNIINEIILSFEAIAYENKIKLINEIQFDVFIEFDKSQFYQLVLILLDNAIKYTPKSESVKVSYFKENKSTYLSVKNTGISLTKDEMNNLFERFYRTDQSREQRTNSFGLGLSIAYEIAKSNNVELSVRSSENLFTEFLVKIK